MKRCFVDGEKIKNTTYELCQKIINYIVSIVKIYDGETNINLRMRR